MGISKPTLLTREAFMAFIQLPGNDEKFFELINAEPVEKMPSFPYVSALALKFVFFFMLYLQNNDIAHITGEQGGYDIDDENTYAPDVAIILKSRQPELPKDEYTPIPPDIVIEIVSASDLQKPKQRIQQKLERYLAAGVPLIWYVYPERREIEVHRPEKPIQIVTVDNILDAEPILPGFRLHVKDIFK